MWWRSCALWHNCKLWTRNWQQIVHKDWFLLLSFSRTQLNQQGWRSRRRRRRGSRRVEFLTAVENASMIISFCDVLVLHLVWPYRCRLQLAVRIGMGNFALGYVPQCIFWCSSSSLPVRSHVPLSYPPRSWPSSSWHDTRVEYKCMQHRNGQDATDENPLQTFIYLLSRSGEPYCWVSLQPEELNAANIVNWNLLLVWLFLSWSLGRLTWVLMQFALSFQSFCNLDLCAVTRS